MKKVVWSDHAALALRERTISREWAELTILAPERQEPDEERPHRTRAYRKIPEFGDRWLRVMYEEDEQAITVVTVFFDRNAGRRL